MDENNSKPRVEYSEFRRMLEEMRGNKQNSAQDSDNELTNNIKDLVVVIKELTKNITMIIGGQRTAPMGTTPFTAALQNSNNPKIQSDEDQLEAIKREDEQTELLRIIAKNTGYREKATPEKTEEFSGGLISKIALAGVAIAGLLYGYFQTWFKAVKFLFNGITKALKGAYELLIPETLRKSIGNSFSGIATFFSDLGTKVKSLFVFDESSKIGKAITAIKDAFKSVAGMWSKISEGISGAVKAVTKIPGISAFLKGAAKVFMIATPIGRVLGILIAVYDTISGALKGWEKGGFIGAITGAMQGLIGGFIGGFADFIKSIVSWTLGALGFTGIEKFLDSFSFTKIINDFIEAVMSPLQLLQDVIMHPIESLKKLGGIISDVFTKITKVFDPVIEFFSGIGKSVIGMLEGIGIPEIGFTIPIIGKKVSIGPFYPFKSDAKKPVAPAETPPAKTAPEAADTKLAPQNRAPAVAPAAAVSAAKMPAEQVANVDAKTNTKGSGTFNKAGFTPDGKRYEFKSEKEIDDAVESGKLFPQVAETRREILETRRMSAGMKPGETRTLVGGVPVANVAAQPPAATPSPAVATPIKASPIVEAKTPAVATPIKAKVDNVEQTRMAARGMYQAGTKEEEAAKQKLKEFEKANPFDYRDKPTAMQDFLEVQGTGKFNDPKKQKEYDALMDTSYKAADKKEKAKLDYETSDKANEYNTNKFGQLEENLGAIFAKKDVLLSRFGYKESDLLNADGKSYSISKINTAYDKNVNKDLMSTATPKASPIVEKAATPIAGGGQTVNPSAQNYNAKAAGTETKAPEKASPIVEGKKVGPNWLEAQRRYAREDSSTPADHLSGQFPGIQARFRELASKAKPLTDSYQSIEKLEQDLVSRAMIELKGKQTVTPEMQAMRKANERSAALAQAASTGTTIEAKTSDVANSRDALTTSGNGSSAIVNAPTTVNNTNQNTTVAKSPFRNEEGTINKYYSTRLGAY